MCIHQHANSSVRPCRLRLSFKSEIQIGEGAGIAYLHTESKHGRHSTFLSPRWFSKEYRLFLVVVVDRIGNADNWPERLAICASNSAMTIIELKGKA